MKKSDYLQSRADVKSFKFWLSFVILPFLAIIIFGSTIFGFYRASQDQNLKSGSAFQNQYQIEVNVQWNDSDEDIYYIANYFSKQLKTLGIYDGNVDVLDSDDLLVSFPVESLNNVDDERFSYDVEKDFQEELLTVESTLFNMSYVEFRTLDGQQLFVYDENGDVVFQQPETPETGTEGNPVSFDMGNSTISNFDDQSESRDNFDKPYDVYDIELIDHADVNYSNGNPYVEIFPKDQYLSQFYEAVDYLSNAFDQATNPTGSTYTVWFGYDLLDYIITTVDGDNYETNFEGDLYSYVFTDETGNTSDEPIDIAKPFYVSTGNILKTQSKYQDSFGIYGDFSVNEANSIANQINFANNIFELSIRDQGLKFETLNFKILKWIFLVFVLFIILLIALFVWWFGLLAVINLSFSLTSGVLLTLPFLFLAVPLSFLSLTIVMFSSFLAFYFQYIILDLYKNKTLNANTSSWKKTKNNFLLFNKKIFAPLFIILFPLAISAFLMSTIVQFYVYYFLISVFIIALVSYFISIPILFVMDLLFKFSFREPKDDQKWSFLIGAKTFDKEAKSLTNTDLNKFSKENGSRKLAAYSLFVFAIISLLGFGLLGFYQLADTSGVNKMLTDGRFYQYEVLKTLPDDQNSDPTIVGDPNDPNYSASKHDIGSDLENENDSYQQEVMIEELEDNQEEIIAIFESNGIEINSYQMTRFENYEVNNQKLPNGGSDISYEYQFSYGLTLYSKDQITNDNYDNLQKDLANLVKTSDLTVYGKDGEILFSPGYSYHYTLINKGSLLNYDQLGYAQAFQDYNYNNYFSENSFAIFIFYLSLFIILLVFFRWAISSAIILSSILESSVLFAILLIVFVPFSIFFWFAFIAMISLSVFSKIHILNINKKEDGKNKITINQNNNFFPFFILTCFFLLSLLYIIFIGMPILVVLLTLFVFAFILLYSNLFIYPHLVAFMSNLRKKHLDQLANNDEKLSKEKDNVSEEYIKGINK